MHVNVFGNKMYLCAVYSSKIWRALYSAYQASEIRIFGKLILAIPYLRSDFEARLMQLQHVCEQTRMSIY